MKYSSIIRPVFLVNNYSSSNSDERVTRRTNAKPSYYMSWGGQTFFYDLIDPHWVCLGTHRHPWHYDLAWAKIILGFWVQKLHNANWNAKQSGIFKNIVKNKKYIHFMLQFWHDSFRYWANLYCRKMNFVL